jgi:hypothetical protein
MHNEVKEFIDRFPFARHEVVCPVSGCYGDSWKPHLKAAIVHLNDRHHWTREDIADWLDTLPLDLTIGERA